MKRVLFFSISLIISLTLLLQTAFCDDLMNGWQAQLNGDYETALKAYKPLAFKGDAKAQFNLGIMYRKGLGVVQDYERAVYWFAKSAEQGEVAAQSNLGGMYYTGQGASQDYRQAYKWLSKASDQGNVQAQSTLGFMYANAQGTARDLKLAYIWSSLADIGGNKNAMKIKEILAGMLSPEELSEAQDEVRKKFAEIEAKKAKENSPFRLIVPSQ